MFENMVRSAALPVLCEVLDAVERALQLWEDNLAAEIHEANAKEDHVRAATFSLQIETLRALKPAIVQLGDELDDSHAEAHGNVAPRQRLLR